MNGTQVPFFLFHDRIREEMGERMRNDDYVAKLMSIAQQSNPATSIEVRIAQVMLANLNELGNIQNQELAKLCYVDAATISRFVRSLGFLKYGEFKSYFKEYNEIHGIDYYYSQQSLPTSKEMLENTICAIEKNYTLLDEKQMDRISKKLLNEKEILIGGDRFAQLVAKDLQLKLLSLGVYAKTYEDVKLQFEEIKNNKGLFVLFSASYTRSKAIVSLAKEKGWNIIIITRNNEAKADEVVLYGDSNNSSWTVNSTIDRLCMGFIVDELILKIASSAIK